LPRCNYSGLYSGLLLVEAATEGRTPSIAHPMTHHIRGQAGLARRRMSCIQAVWCAVRVPPFIVSKLVLATSNLPIIFDTNPPTARGCPSCHRFPETALFPGTPDPLGLRCHGGRRCFKGTAKKTVLKRHIVRHKSPTFATTTPRACQNAVRNTVVLPTRKRHLDCYRAIIIMGHIRRV